MPATSSRYLVERDHFRRAWRSKLLVLQVLRQQHQQQRRDAVQRAETTVIQSLSSRFKRVIGAGCFTSGL